MAIGQSQGVPDILPPTSAWKAKVASLTPSVPSVKPKKPRKVLVCSLATGFCHQVIPHVQVVMDTLAASGAFEVTHSNNIESFAPEQLSQFDAVVLNNTCTKRPNRNWFIDVLAEDKSLTQTERQQRAAELEKSLLDFVASGKGIVAIHGAIVFLNESQEFSRMMGGSFDKHPKLQTMTLNLVEPKHPLLKAFGGKPFTHLDEPYLFNKAYQDKPFRPLLEMDVDALNDPTRKVMRGDRRFVSWIKPYGKGRVFYCSPSHRPETFERSEFLHFLLDGIQYALGDLECDDSVPSP